MARQVERHVSKDSAGNKIVEKVVHVDRPRKTVDKVVVREKDAETGEVKVTRSKSVKQK